MSKITKADLAQDAGSVLINNNQDLPLAAQQALAEAQARERAAKLTTELNGPKGLEPTRYGDWEAKGRCYDF